MRLCVQFLTFASQPRGQRERFFQLTISLIQNPSATGTWSAWQALVRWNEEEPQTMAHHEAMMMMTIGRIFGAAKRGQRIQEGLWYDL